MQQTLENFAIANGLNTVTSEVRRTWRAEDYPELYQTDFAQFRHAAIHAVKAIGQIMALIDLIEHQSESNELGVLNHKLPKLLGDLVRCAAKMAIHAPARPLSLSASYIDRAEELAERWGHASLCMSGCQSRG